MVALSEFFQTLFFFPTYVGKDIEYQMSSLAFCGLRDLFFLLTGSVAALTRHETGIDK